MITQEIDIHVYTKVFRNLWKVMNLLNTYTDLETETHTYD